MPIMSSLQQLLGPERNQHAEDDDSDFTDKLAPAVQRLRQMEVHSTDPQR